MKVKTAQDLPVFDWADLILEAQTAPDGEVEQAHGALYVAIHPWVDEITAQWAKSKGIAECHVDDLYALGIAHVFEKLHKFESQTEDPVRLTRKFRAWIAIICRNRWIDEYRKQVKDFDRFKADRAADEDTPWNSEAISRNKKEEMRINAAYQYCLGKLPTPMQSAILETEALRIEQGTIKNARGKAGEANAIAEKYGYKPDNVRQARRRLKLCVEAEYEKGYDK
ncbi:MAG: hypothetical protein KUF77_11675 [Candidatus Thiodiazotropha sp. (ex Lucina aurantia)]|nr:hypothetical protein [Candidatus Thiodiazotropha taylori]MBV2098750.1 hypothetical protein [Candidatus Thiodiazotropha sp. (ex Codakia orbicularis)]MBV2103674.1 hypothetical protein [Candidatus Thiodiazotropha sp. (ex Lucina aurantia)]MBV2118113.1 hypothetical protein [Candidatus Thiodiazotropha sp. (ex Lucina aurantia)]